MKKRKISVIDDSAAVLQEIQDTINTNLRNINVEVFQDPNAAYTHISEHNGNDLILMGCDLLEVSGKQLYSDLRRAGIRTPVCFFSDNEETLKEYKTIPGTYTWNFSQSNETDREFLDKIAVIMSEYRNSRDIEGLSLDVEDMKGLLNRILNKLDELDQKIEERTSPSSSKSSITNNAFTDLIIKSYNTVAGSNKAKAIRWFFGMLWFVIMRIAAVGFFIGVYYSQFSGK